MTEDNKNRKNIRENIQKSTERSVQNSANTTKPSKSKLDSYAPPAQNPKKSS